MRYPALLLAILMALFGMGPVHAQTQPPSAGVVNTTANLRAGPGASFDIVGSVAQGVVVEIRACNEGCTWYQVAEGQWIAAFLVVPLPATPVPAATAQPVTQPATGGTTLTLVSWNVESGGALQNVVADRMAAFDGVDIWGLSEVNALDAEAFEFGAEEGEGADFDSLLGSTGGADRLLLIWDAARFERLDQGEMREIGESGRAPLWALLRERGSGDSVIVMVNHLHRSNEGIRHRQAQALNAWAGAQTLPVIALGDYNFDWNLPDGVSRDEGFDLMTAGGVWEWVRPAQLVTTQCTGWPCRYNSILDFVFVAGAAREWPAQAEIVVVERDFPDDLTTPDHRPLLAVFGGSASPGPTATAAPTSAPVATPMQPVGATANGNGNLREGPGTSYGIVGSASAGQALQIVGRNQAGDWYKLASGAWIAAFLVDNAPGNLPVAAAPTAPAPPTAVPQPTAAATQVVAPTATPVPPPTATPMPPQPEAPAGSGCDPSYPTICVPPPPPDLDCGDIPQHARFTVLPPDPHGFDGRDNDGLGCESN